MTTVLMVGTRKGLWIGTSDESRSDWRFTGPHHDMEEVYSCLIDVRGGRPRLLAGASSPWLGPRIRSSEDLGASWQEGPPGALGFPVEVAASVERIWQLVPGLAPDVVYAGTEPAGLWRSVDAGRTFELVRPLWDHPHRPDWGAGYGGQAFHTLLPHPEDPARMLVALSTGGVYRTEDGGRSWSASNSGIRADFLPEGEQYPEFGQCVHKVTRHPARPDRLFLQNHGGVYRSDDEGRTWSSIAEGLPADFGFPIVVHPQLPDTVFVFPINSGAGRYPPQGRALVWRSDDAGESWSPHGDGLPEPFFVGVMRDAMCTDDHDRTGLYVGARNGTVWNSTDGGESWRPVVANLPDVMVVRAAWI